MLDIVHRRGERALERSHDAAVHLVGRQAGVLPHDADHRNLNVRKDVGRGAQRRERAEDENQQRKHHERVGTPQGNSNQGQHGVCSPQLSAMTLTATTKKHAIPIGRTQSGLVIVLAAAARTAGKDFIVNDLCWLA